MDTPREGRTEEARHIAEPGDFTLRIPAANGPRRYDVLVRGGWPLNTAVENRLNELWRPELSAQNGIAANENTIRQTGRNGIVGRAMDAERISNVLLGWEDLQ